MISRFRLLALQVVSVIVASWAAPGVARAQQNPFLPPAASYHDPRIREFHDRNIKLVLDLHPSTHSADGMVTHTLLISPSRHGDRVQGVVLDAGPGLTIHSCSVNGVSATFRHEAEKLTITPSIPLVRGTVATVEVRYTMNGAEIHGAVNGIAGFHWVDEDPQYPERQATFWTQGETESNHSWVPCYDYPNDKCTSETITTVPEDWIVIGNGVEGNVTHDVAHHTRTFRWTMTQPHSTYLLSLLGGHLDEQRAEWRGVPLIYVVPRGLGRLIPTAYGNTPDMLSFFSDKLGVKYAWPKYAQSSMFDFGGGMENVSATTLGADMLADARSGRFADSWVNSHELAHQWFGDLVTCKFWGDIWLNESFATFFEMVFLEHQNGKDEYDQDRENARTSYLDESRRYKRPVSTHYYPSPDSMFDRHTYPKGGLILHMLRRELGDDLFFRGLGHYLRVHGYTPVETLDLETALNESTGKSVEPFFNQWIFKPGHPVLDMTWSYDYAAHTVVIHVLQKQDTSDGTPVYDVPLAFAFLSTSSAAVDRHEGRLNLQDQTFTFPVAAAPDAVLMDPNHDLLKDVPDTHWTAAQLPAILKHAPCVLDREAAARQLGLAPSTDATTGLLVSALKDERSEGAAAAIVRVLGDTHSESLRALYRSLVASTQIELSAAAIEAIGKLKITDADLSLLRSYAGSDTAPYAEVSAALTALGGARFSDNLNLFRHQLKSSWPLDRAANTALNVGASAPGDAAKTFLTGVVSGPFRTRFRIDAVNRLAGMTRGDQDIADALVAVLHENKLPDLQMAAIRALQSRGDKSATDALRTIASGTATQPVRDQARAAADALAK